MNFKIAWVFLTILALGMVIAQSEDATQSDASSSARVDAIQPVVDDMNINLVSPANGFVYQFPTTADINALNIDFEFSVDPVTPANVEADCKVNIEGTSDFIVDADVMDTGRGFLSLQFGSGTYTWRVECVKGEFSFLSDTYSFEIRAPEVSNPGNNNPTSNNNNNGNSKRNSDDDSNGRRLQPVSLPLQELSNTAEGSEDQESSAGITGAVIGALGKKTLTGIIILAVVLGAAGLVIYNRRKLGVVKAN
jgi:hypothetical protein